MKTRLYEIQGSEFYNQHVLSHSATGARWYSSFSLETLVHVDKVSILALLFVNLIYKFGNFIDKFDHMIKILIVWPICKSVFIG